MDIDNFFEDLNEKNWKQNIETEASFLFEEFLNILKESKEEIVKSSIKDVSILQEMKTEENQEFTYKLFKEWLRSCMIENIYNELSEDE